jgi:hypothetical protein
MIGLLLYKNNIGKKKKNNYYAQLHSSGVADNEALADIIIKRGSEIKRETIISILNQGDRLRMELLAEGFRVNSPIFNTQVSVVGNFDKYTKRFDPDLHRLKLKISPTKEMAKMLEEADVMILGPAQVMPVIGIVKDIKTQSTNDILSCGEILEITGKRIKLIGDDPLVGVYFINDDTKELIKCKTPFINEPQKLMIQIPEMPKGIYHLKIVTQYTPSHEMLKIPLSTQFRFTFTVQ